jgi:hypothetical protein
MCLSHLNTNWQSFKVPSAMLNGVKIQNGGCEITILIVSLVAYSFDKSILYKI